MKGEKIIEEKRIGKHNSKEGGGLKNSLHKDKVKILHNQNQFVHLKQLS